MRAYDNIVRRMTESTTMSSITYLPSGLGAVQSAVRSLARMKKQWKIEILGNEDNKNVVFEDQLSITVANQYWDSFAKLFDSSLDKGEVDLQKYLNEAMEEDLSALRDEIKPALTKLLEIDIFRSVERAVGLFRASFGVMKHQEADTAITCENKERDIQKISYKLIDVYGKDRGNLELIGEALKERQALNTFDGFKNYDFLYGTRIYTEYRKIGIFFEATVDFAYLVNQSLLIEDETVLSKLQDEPNIKVVKGAIFPVGNMFDSNFFRALKNTIKDVVE